MKRVVVDGVWKKFSIGTKKKQRTLERLVSVFSGREPRKSFWALKGVSFDMDAGEIMGIIGSNGSGKSTLLRIIADIYDKDGGQVRTEGNIVSLIDMYTGLDPRLSARDNIYLCCLMFGLKQKDIKRRFREILDFAGLQKYENTKLYQFSSGMISRLAFSIAIHSIVHENPEILLLDEVFAVGDENYVNKCMKKLNELLKSGATIIMVSHHLDIIGENCKRIIWMDGGKIVRDGGTEVLDEYVKVMG